MAAHAENPWEINFLDEALNQELFKHFKGDGVGYVQVGSKKYFLPSKIAEDVDVIRGFRPRSTDVWVVTYPRSGTTWTQEMVWLLANDLDYSTAANVLLLDRFPFLEFSSCISRKMLAKILENADSVETRRKIEEASAPVYTHLENMKAPRFIKSHLPLSLLHPELLQCGAKVIYVARNPKDVAVSYYNFHHFFKTLDFVGDFETFWNYFERNLQLWSPYWAHIDEAWKSRSNPNLLFLFYEDMTRDLTATVTKVSKFLGKEYSGEEIGKLVQHLSFDNFKKNPSVNMEVLRELGFLMENDQRCVRRGTSGSWREYFDDRLNAQADRWIRENLKGTDLTFPDYKEAI